jgi:predicted phosphoribosyltransferase
VQIGCEVAQALNADLAMIIARPLVYPDIAEPSDGGASLSGATIFGAMAEDGSVFIHREAERRLRPEIIEQVKAAQQREIERQIAVLRKGRPLPELAGRSLILVDDGMAGGIADAGAAAATMRVVVAMCRKAAPARVVVAVPVASERAILEVGPLVDELVVLERPLPFQTIAQVYERWHPVSDREVLDIMGQLVGFWVKTLSEPYRSLAPTAWIPAQSDGARTTGQFSFRGHVTRSSFPRTVNRP